MEWAEDEYLLFGDGQLRALFLVAIKTYHIGGHLNMLFAEFSGHFAKTIASLSASGWGNILDGSKFELI